MSKKDLNTTDIQNIKDIGIAEYLERLIGILKKINTFEFGTILEEFGKKCGP